MHCGAQAADFLKGGSCLSFHPLLQHLNTCAHDLACLVCCCAGQ